MSHRSLRTATGLRALGMTACLTLGLGLAACTSDQEPVNAEIASPSPEGPGPDDVQYVALGDSYASAPGVPETDNADGCFRSSSNYASVLAESADLYLTDATCSGADSDEIISQQVPLLSADTDIVTVGTGGNDFSLFIRVLQGCLTQPGGDSASDDDGDAGSDARPTCSEIVATEVQPVAEQIQAKMGEVLDAVTEAAPDATVYVVGYPVVLPETGACPDLVPMAAEDYPLVAGVTRALSDGLRIEAEARDLPFVDVFAASQGHDVCADEPWVNGALVGDDGTAPFHPFAVEQAAVAALVEDML